MILVLSGTQDGREIVRVLRQKGCQVMASTVTEYGKFLLQEKDDILVIEGGLKPQDMEELLITKGITTVVDATHPFAVQVSRMAVDICSRIKIFYIRYEREKTTLAPQKEGIIWTDSFQDAAHKASRYKGNVFLTIGSNHLEEFCKIIPVARLIARVLPQSKVLKKCEELGFYPSQIVALQGPFSPELNKELYLRYQAGVMVTKDSGKTGGTEDKVAAAGELGIPAIIVGRPAVLYPLVVQERDKLLEYVLQAEKAKSSD